MPINWTLGLFDYDRWMPRWACGKWEIWEGNLYITSDILIALAYFAIPTIIAAYVWKRKAEVPFLHVFWLFFFFIFLCGATHLVDAIIFYKPIYQFSAFLRFATALVSWATVFALIYYLPAALKLKTAAQFEHELKQRESVEQQLEEKFHELEVAQRIAKVGTYRYTFDMLSFSASNTFFEIFGLEPTETYTALKLRENLHPDDLVATSEYLGRVKEEGGTFDMQYRYIKTDGEVVYIHSRGEVTKDEAGNSIGMQGSIQDISELKNIEINLQRRAQELESINKELELFAYAASHDLQEPLRKLRAFGDRLSQRYADQLDEQGQDYIARMDKASARMQTLIDDLLAYSRLSRNKDQKEHIDLQSLIEDVLSDLDEVITEKNIQIDMDNLPSIDAVPGQMRQLFQNLLSNAFKFTKEQGPHIVSISCRVVKGHQLPWKSELIDMAKYYEIVIKDNGIGFDQQFEERIFVMFQRLHGRTDFPGTGIGLALCKKIVENHGGIIKAHGEENKGATFTVLLPVKKN